MKKKDSFKVRFAKTVDVPELVNINIDGHEEYRSTNVALFKNLVKDKMVMLATQENKVVGLCYWRCEFLGRSHQWYLRQITVHKKYRKCGIGELLLTTFLDFATQKKVEKVFADIHNDNRASLSLFLGKGALISGTIEGIGNTRYKDERVIVRFELKKKK